MKKVYEKPQIVFESFEMSSSIAAGCEFTDVNATQGVCAYLTRYGNRYVTIFTSDVGACHTTEQGGGVQEDGYNRICYHVPNDNNDLFNS